MIHLLSISERISLIVGYFILFRIVYRFVILLYRFTRYKTDWNEWGPSPSPPPSSNGTSEVRWAIITGCTDGIGKEFAIQLASKGFNIALLSRNGDKLLETAKLVEKFGVQSDCFTIDFAKATPKQFEDIGNWLKGKNIGVLVNNVGASYKFPQYLEEVPLETIETLTALNISTSVAMIRLVVPGMRSIFSSSKKRSLIVNMGSVSFLGAPLLGHYAGSKAYITSLSQSLSEDYSSLGIDVMVLNPAMIATKMSSIRTGSLLFPSPERYVKSALNAMGDKSMSGQAGYWVHDIGYFLLNNVIPLWMVQPLILKFHKSLRSRGFKKAAEREQAPK